MTTDFRALCAELADELTQFNAWYIEDNGYGLPALEALLRRSDAALAQSDEPAVPEGREPGSVAERPTVMQIIELSDEIEAAGLGQIDFARAVLARWGTPNLAETRSSLGDAPQPLAEDRELAPVTKQPTVMQLIELSEEIEADGLGQIDFARAVLARWGNPAPQHNPWKDTLLDALVCNFLLNAENEDNPKKALNDLIAWEKQLATDPLINPELQPVPISERLPEPKDCDAEGRCWWWHPSHAESGYWEGWMLRPRAWGVGRYDFDDRLVHTHWLPAHALPLPTVND